MGVSCKMDYHYYSRRKRDEVKAEAEQKKVEKQRFKYNLLGILALLIALLFALDIFNVSRFFTGN
jgi:uncharacterized protein YqhQ